MLVHRRPPRRSSGGAALARALVRSHGRRRWPRRLLLLLLLLHLRAHHRLELLAHAAHEAGEGVAAVEPRQQLGHASHWRLA